MTSGRGEAIARIALWGAYVVSRVLMAGVLTSSDLKAYFLRLNQGALLEEYGPLANALMLLPLQMAEPGNPVQFILGAKALGLMLDAVLVQQIMRHRRLPQATVFILGSALLHLFWIDRLDLYVAALLLLSIRSRHLGRALAIAAAALIKFPFLAIGAVHWLRARTRQNASLFGAAAGVFAAALLMTATVTGAATTISPLTYHAGRTPQMEGLVGNLMYLGATLLGWPLHVTVDHGAAHLHGPSDGLYRAIALLTFLAGVGLTAVRIAQRGTTWRSGDAVLLAVVAYTAFNPVGSGQFAVVPLVLAPWVLAQTNRGTLLLLLLLLVYAACTARAFSHYPWKLGLDAEFGFWTLLRNLSLLGCWGLLMARRTELSDETEA